MGLFDTVRCHYRLSNPAHQELEFQTKDLECLLDDYVITFEGRLIRLASGSRKLERDIEWPFHGDILMYTTDPERDQDLVEYTVRFTHGRVEWIRPLGDRAAGVAAEDSDAAPSREGAGSESAVASNEERSAEVRLLANIRMRRQELQGLFIDCSDHWRFEDPVYRFYHQSFKVYVLQDQTRTIVRTLQSLAPDRPLNPWFVEIVDAGTGKRFEPEDNAEWTRVTRPIVEAFFHARFFLEMTIRYADLEAPPNPLPSGYAALLRLYGLR